MKKLKSLGKSLAYLLAGNVLLFLFVGVLSVYTYFIIHIFQIVWKFLKHTF